MAININKRLAQAALTTSAAVIYTAPSNSQAVMADAAFTNTTSGALKVTLHIVPSGASAATANKLLSSVSVPANTTLQWTGFQVVNGGDSIQALADAAGITATISGQEYKINA